MAFRYWITFFVGSICFYWVVCQNISGPNICRTSNSKHERCCKDFYFKENKCVECEPGYFGINCSIICPSGYFGSRCRERCQCSMDMYCEPTRGCLCNAINDNCTESGQEMNKDSTTSTVYQPNQIADNKTEFLMVCILPLSVPVVVCFVIGLVCIRHARKQKNTMDHAPGPSAGACGSVTDDNASPDAYNHLNFTGLSSSSSLFSEEEKIGVREPAPYPKRTIDILHQENDRGIHVNQHPLPTVFERNSEKFDGSYFIMTHKKKLSDKPKHQQEDRYLKTRKKGTEELLYINSNEGHQKIGGKKVKYNFPEPIQDTAVFKKLQKEKSTSQIGCSNDEEIYANTCDPIYTNNFLKTEEEADSEDTEAYINLKYEGQKTITESVRSSSPSKASIEKFDNINCDTLI